MATGYTREWIQFFTGCGIPADVAAMYALIFHENRIQKNMLLDLNKEYLRDMGITVMGDVIAILRYAKIIHEKYLRAQILSVEDNATAEKTSSVGDTTPTVKKTAPLKRILQRYTRKYSTPDSEVVNQVQVMLPNETFCNKGGDKIETQRPLKKKIQILNTDDDLKEKGLEVPVPKVRRVLPENEGGYKIKMPSGTTERSKKLLELAKKRKAKTVFDRLGESSVSSTTSEISTISSTSTTLFREKNPSVFSRLGEKTSIVSSTSSIDGSEITPPEELQYAGVLKPGGHKKNLSSTTMRADAQQTEVSKVKAISVKKRLGLSKPSGQPPPEKRTTLKAVRRKGEGELKTTVIRTNKVNTVQREGKSKIAAVISKNFQADSTQVKPTATVTTNRIQKANVISLKRKLSEDSDVSPLKKVRFGRTTHRLIPSSPSSSDPVSYVKNYPKLTMIINNRENAAENNTLSSGIRIGSLSSDNLSGRLGVKSRIGNKFPEKRLRRAGPGQGQPQDRKGLTVKNRLG